MDEFEKRPVGRPKKKVELYDVMDEEFRACIDEAIRARKAYATQMKSLSDYIENHPNMTIEERIKVQDQLAHNYDQLVGTATKMMKLRDSKSNDESQEVSVEELLA